MLESALLPDLLSLKEEYTRLSPLVEKLKISSSVEERLEHLNQCDSVKKFFDQETPLHNFLQGMSGERELVVKALAAIEQAEHIFAAAKEKGLFEEQLEILIDELVEVEAFYREIGGIVGYHYLMLECLLPAQAPSLEENLRYEDPEAIDISLKTEEVRRAIVWGIESLAEMAEIYPVGGAADRLNLQEEKSGTPLPAAKLPFGGKTLLEGLIADLQAREYLHYKLFHKQLYTPVVMMTSQEKDNHAQILSICREKGWFGRPQSAFRFISQPSVPAMNREGLWCLQGDFQLLLKPSGHGVIWKLAQNSKAFEWLFSLGRKKALVRQINNPLAGIDHGLLAFTGIGCTKNKLFGFASCPRRIGAAEGVNVLLERRCPHKTEYVLTNVEYSDLHKLSKAGYSERKLANTNILFIDLAAVDAAVKTVPFPGVIVNPKKMSYKKGEELVEEEVARLESTMQNIADCFVDSFPHPLPTGKRRDAFNTFVTFNERKKTISTVKRASMPGGPLGETPEGCFLDLLENAKELFLTDCKMRLVQGKKTGVFSAPLISYHPALGPLYSIIAQKIRGGTLSSTSELRLMIAELEMVDLDLDGSLSIRAEDLLGHHEGGVLIYSERSGKCVLKNVRVKNAGLDTEANHVPWKGEFVRKECCTISIRGDGEFYAENVTFLGPYEIVVEAGVRLIAEQQGSSVVFRKEKIVKPRPLWNYSLTKDFHIVLKKSEI